MTTHLQRAIDQIMKQLISLSANVEDSVKHSIEALQENNPQMAKAVYDGDQEIDKRELVIEEECLKIFALYQPVARDLRYLVAILKINNDLERIGDLANHIAYHVMQILAEPILIKPTRLDIIEIYQKVRNMFKKSLDLIVNLNIDTAYEILKADDEVDQMQRSFEKNLIEVIKNDPQDTEVYINYIDIARNLERIADHATNIAEDIIYLIKGDIIRHGSLLNA